MTATGHGPASLAFSPHGDLLAVANPEGNSVQIFSVSAGGVLKAIGHTQADGPVSLAFSPTRSLLAVANGGTASVSVFSVSEDGGLTLVATKATGAGPSALAFGRDGDRELLAVTSRDTDSVWMYSVSSLGQLDQVGPTTPTEIGPRPRAVAFSRDGKRLAITAGDTAPTLTGSVSVFSVATDGSLDLAGFAHTFDYEPEGVAFSRDGRHLAATNPDYSSVSMFSVSEAGELSGGALFGAGYFPTAVAFSPTGDLLASAATFGYSVSMHAVSPDGTVTDVRSATPTGRLPAALTFSPNGRLLATANRGDDSVSMFSVSADGVLTPIGSPTPTGGGGGGPKSIVFSPDGRLLATANYDDDSVSVFSVSAGGALTLVGAPITTGNGPKSVAFSPDGSLLVTANYGNRSLSVFSVSEDGVLTPIGSSIPTIAFAVSVVFSPDGRFLATANELGDSVSVFSISPAGVVTPVGFPTSAGDGPTSVAFSPDGTLLAAADHLGDSVMMFSVSSDGVLTEVGTPMSTNDFPASVVFSPDGRSLATASPAADAVMMFSVAPDGAMQLLGDRNRGGSSPSSVVFSPNGRLVATGNAEDNSLSLFSVGPDGVLSVIGSPTPTGDDPESVAFSPDGTLLATANYADDSVSVFPLAAPALDTAIVSRPPAVTSATTAAFGFEGNYPATFECSLDSAAFEPCEGPVAYAGLAEGDHRFEVRASDLLGNPEVAPEAWAWKVDVTPPSAPSLALPGEAAGNLPDSVGFVWATATDNTGIDRYELWIDGVSRGTVPAGSCHDTCPGTPVASLTDGPHTWQVRAVDRAGLVAESEPRAFSVDATPPSSFSLVGPEDDAATGSRRPTLSWQASAGAGAGLAGYDVQVDDHVLGSVGASATSFTPAAELAEGLHHWQVVAKDANGNPRASGIQRFTVDGTPPVARLTAAPNPVLAGRTVTFDAGESSDAGSGIASYEWDLDGDGVFERNTDTAATTAQTYAEPGTFGVQLRVTDRVGRSATTRIDQRVSTDSRRRGQLGVSIDDGAGYTNDPNVTITAAWPSFASEMLVSNDGGFKTARTFGLRTSSPWTLDSSGADRLPKIVYVRFLRGLTVSETYTDDIILDQRAPSVTSAEVSPGKRTAVALLRLRARDRGLAGLKAVQVTNDRRRPKARFRAYHPRVKLAKRKGERRLSLRKQIFVRVRDRAGNLSSWHAADN